MMQFYLHADDRGCGYHSRLGKWTFGWPITNECLRSHLERDNRVERPSLHDRVLNTLRRAGKPVPWAELTDGIGYKGKVGIRDIVEEWEEQGKVRSTIDGIEWIGEVDHP